MSRMRDNEDELKIELLSQWKLKAESRKKLSLRGFKRVAVHYGPALLCIVC